MHQQQSPEELDLGYGEDSHKGSAFPQHHDNPSDVLTTRQVQIEERTSDRFEATSSYGDSYTGSDGSCYDDSFTSWEDGMITAQNAAPKPKKKKVAARQQKRVSQARIFVLVLLGLTAVAISLLVYFVARDKEEKDYKHHVSCQDMIFGFA
jgi:hypothetical protein